MNKNTIIGFILMGLVLFGFSWYNQPSEEQINDQRKQDSIENVLKEKAEREQMAKAAAKKVQAEAAVSDSTQLFFPALQGKNRQLTLKNKKMELKVNTKGGYVAAAKLLGFKDKSGEENLTLFADNDQSLNFMLAGKQTNIITADLFFEPSNATDSTLTLTAKAANGGELTLNYRLGENYLLHLSMQTKGLNGIFAPNYRQVDIEWTGKCRQQEKGFTFESRYATLTYKEKDDDSDYLSETDKVVDEPYDRPTEIDELLHVEVLVERALAVNVFKHLEVVWTEIEFHFGGCGSRRVESCLELCLILFQITRTLLQWDA